MACHTSRRIVILACLIILSCFSLAIVSGLNEESRINTQYVHVGQLHSGSDFSGVLINLNVKEAIDQGEKALTLANAYLVYHRKKTVIGPWSGHLRNIHFLNLKKQLLEKNLLNLKTDLHAAKKQYSLPLSTTSVSSSRPKRAFNFDVKWDVGNCLASIVTGVVSLFFAPPSLDKIEKSVTKISYRTSRLESQFKNYTENLDLMLVEMEKDLQYDMNKIHLIASVSSSLDLANDNLSKLLASITPLVKGHLTHFLLDPLQSQTLISRTQDMADKFNMQVVIEQPIEILQCSITTFATNDSWYALISIPLIHRSETLQAYQFINIPFFHRGQAVQWDLENGIIATKSGLYPFIKNVFISSRDLPIICEKFGSHFLCHTRINHEPTCHISLLYHHAGSCKLKKASSQVRYSYGPFNYLFFQSPTDTLVKCPKEHFNIKFHGLVNFEEIQNCKIITKKFTLLPKSSTFAVSTFANKSVYITILNHELLKVKLQFNRENAVINEDSIPSSTNDTQNFLDEPEDADFKPFGTYTVLINSVLLLIMLTIMIVIVGLCLNNFIKHISEGV